MCLRITSAIFVEFSPSKTFVTIVRFVRITIFVGGVSVAERVSISMTLLKRLTGGRCWRSDRRG